MAVGAAYLTKLVRAVRMTAGTDINAELTDIIEECRAHLISLGVVATKANDETDELIRGAVRSYCRWKFGLSNEDAEKNRKDYDTASDELRRKKDYIGFAITFACKAGQTAVADAEITFNGETKETDSTGTAVFNYVQAGVNQRYTVVKTGYVSHDVDLDVTATATVNVALVVG
jgi:hypothetical protein